MINDQFEIKIDEIVIPRVQHTKFLGVHIDERLNWQTHFNKLCLKIKRNTSLLRAGFNHLNNQSMWLLYFAQIYSHLSYGISIWGNLLNQANLSKLQKLQNKCVSLILHKKSINKSDYVKNNLLQIEQVIYLENLKFAFKLYHDLLPKQIKVCVTG